MADIVSHEFLTSLKDLYPTKLTYVDSAWFAVAAITFSASNCPEGVPRVLEYVLQDLDAIGASHADRLAAVRKIRDALFKSGVISGLPRVINALILLYEVTPPELRDTQTLRDPHPTIEGLAAAGDAFFDQTYGDTAASTKELLTTVYPELGFFSTTIAYGYVYAFMGPTSPAETSFAMVSALIAIDSPRQIVWHLKSAIRNGATVEEVKAVREIAIRVSKAAGVVWKGTIPDL